MWSASRKVLDFSNATFIVEGEGTINIQNLIRDITAIQICISLYTHTYIIIQNLIPFVYRLAPFTLS